VKTGEIAVTNPTGSVYFVQRGEAGPIKIGFSTDVDARIKELQTGSDERLILLGRVFAGRRVEHAIQQQFKHLWIQGEWYKNDPELLGFIRVINGITFPPSEDARRFRDWLKRYEEDDSPLGDLARDVAADKAFPRSNDLVLIMDHLRVTGCSPTVLKRFHEAWSRWSYLVIFDEAEDE
jgi:uncharacterized protein YozE (UPF0346 family)